ncbi:ABC transporter permease [Oceanobacillus neutriphilus]|uniref:ABC transporter permease n=1 Tax=Oceanobacillus neutriphilus TaxID=531815 RepID=A0ABQ2P2A8_9BACI|nr:FtsX-like permease family protein [Oceanobacillus neutriphilus]GGP16364.1 ABC transporter permease [Oceanobacillus neutriphilus]
MRSVIKHIMINLFEKKFRTLIVLLTVLLTTLVVFIGLSLNEIINNTYTSMLKGAYGDTNIIVSKSDEEPLYEKGDLVTTNVSIENRNDMLVAQGETRLMNEDVNVTLIGMNILKAEESGLVEKITQREEGKLEKDMAVISNHAASEYGLDIGDKISVEAGEDTYEYEIGIIGKERGIFFSELDTITLAVTEAQVNTIFDTKDKVNTSYLSVPENKVSASMEALKEQNPDFQIQNQSTAASTRDEATFETTMLLAIITIVMISSYIIISLAKLIAVERMPVIGTFRSIGASKKLTNFILTLEFLFYGLIGSIIGLALGMAILPYVADVFNEYKELGVETEVNYNMVYLSIAFLFGTLFPPIISYFQIIRMNKKPLKEIILNTAHTAQKRSAVPFIMGILLLIGAFGLYYINRTDDLLISILSILCLFISIVLLMPGFLNAVSAGLNFTFNRIGSGELLLGVKNLGNNKMASNNSNMIIVVFLLLMLVGMIASGIDQYLNKSLIRDYDIAITEIQDDPENFEDVQEIDSVSDTYTQYVDTAEVEIDGQGETLGVLGIDNLESFDSFFSGITFLDDAKEQLNSAEDGIVLDEYQLERFGLQLGDKIELQPLDANYEPLEGEDSTVTATVVGSMESLGFSQNRATALINLSFFKKDFEDTLGQINIKAAPGADLEKVKKEINDHYSNADMTVNTFDEILQTQKSTIDTLILGMTIIVLLGLLIGVLGISNNLLVSFIQRKKEYAVLYSVCMSRGQLVKVLLVETILTFIAVTVAGFAGSLAMNVIMAKLLYAIGLRIDFQFNTGLFLILSVVVLVLLLLSNLSIIRKIYRMNIVESLRFE